MIGVIGSLIGAFVMPDIGFWFLLIIKYGCDVDESKSKRTEGSTVHIEGCYKMVAYPA